MYLNKEYRLSNGEILLVQWEKGWNNFRMSYKGQSLGEAIGKDVLTGGRQYNLGIDGQVMAVLRGNTLEIWQDGNEIVSGLSSGQSMDFQNAINWLFGIGGISIGAMAVLLYADPKPVNLIFLLPGIALVLLGLWAKLSKIKLPLQIALMIAGILLVGSVLTVNIFGGAVQGILAYYLYKGIQTPEHLLQKDKKAGVDDPLDARY